MKLKKWSEKEIENEKPNQILETVNEVLYFNKERGLGSKTARFRSKRDQIKCLVDYQFL